MAYELVTEEEIRNALIEGAYLAPMGYSIDWLFKYRKELEVALRLQMRKTANDTVKLITREATLPDQQNSDGFDLWYRAFQAELALQSGSNVIPKGMDKESYRESFEDGMTPAERATQELDDLSR